MLSHQKSSYRKRFLTKNNTCGVLCGCANFSTVFLQSLYKDFKLIAVLNHGIQSLPSQTWQIIRHFKNARRHQKSRILYLKHFKNVKIRRRKHRIAGMIKIFLKCEKTSEKQNSIGLVRCTCMSGRGFFW